MSKKRPWKKFAKIERIELNNGDVKFEAIALAKNTAFVSHNATFEALTECEAFVNAWWAEYWPVQIKSRRPA